MRVRLVTVGRLKKGPETEMVATYLKRARASGPLVGLSQFEIIELSESRADTAAARKKEEATRILDKLGPGALLFVLDETGEDLKSRALASLLQTHADNGVQDAAFIIGGPDGLDPDLIDKAKHHLRFGRATWPHQLVRIMLTEQLYRAITILQGHPYHRD